MANNFRSMQPHLVFLVIAFVSATFAVDQLAPCSADFLKGRIVTGFYKKSLFYFAYGDDPKIELDPKTLFGDIEIPETANYTAERLVPIDGNRVIAFFKDSEKMSYVVYELDDLTDYLKNGSVMVLQSSDSQDVFENKNVNGSAANQTSFEDRMEWINGKLLLDGKELSGSSEIKVNSGDNQIVYKTHHPYSCKPFIVEGKVQIQRCIDGDKASFVRLANGTRCSYATGALDDFTYVQMLPTGSKINHTSSGMLEDPAVEDPFFESPVLKNFMDDEGAQDPNGPVVNSSMSIFKSAVSMEFIPVVIGMFMAFIMASLA